MGAAIEHQSELPNPAHAEHLRSLRKAAYLTAAMGIAHAILFLLSFWLVSDVPGPKASSQEIIAYYGSDQNRRPILVGLYVMPFAGIAFIWFIVALRMWTSGQVRRENVLLSNVQLVSGILYIALFFGGAAASSACARAFNSHKGRSTRTLPASSPNSEARSCSYSGCGWQLCLSSPRRTSPGVSESFQSGLPSSASSSDLGYCSALRSTAHLSSSSRSGFSCSVPAHPASPSNPGRSDVRRRVRHHPSSRTVSRVE